MRLRALPLALAALAVSACGSGGVDPAPAAEAGAAHDGPARSDLRLDPAAADTAVFAMGCFWCAETAFEGLEGVASVTSGFAGGTVPNPTYAQVGGGDTGHLEVVEVVYDPARVDYATLLRVFWHNVDPVDDAGQFCDHGPSYRAAVFAAGAEQRRLAEASRAEVAAQVEGAVVTEILPGAPFYPAEDYHQDFWLKDPERYHDYRTGCRRDERLDALWGARARVAADAL